ncbi:MAG: NAD(+) synthase [Clostridiaceae bacterium]|nr:NAD(+) synthase [Clostridiaceae bacterium]
MRDGFIKAAAVSPKIKVADCKYNTDQIKAAIKKAAAEGVQLLVLPELSITGYTCGDLFLSRVLQQAAEQALEELAAFTTELDMVVLVGLPLAVGNNLYNTAAVLNRGEILGIVPKQYVPNYGEFYEMRHFTSASQSDLVREIDLCGRKVIFGQRQLFSCTEMPDLTIAAEICEDLWVAQQPSARHSLAGATVICNLSASDEIIGKADYRRMLVKSQSARLICGYIYADAGIGESTTDLVFAGHNMIYENGRKLAEAELFSGDLIITELDMQLIASERRRQNTYGVIQNDLQLYDQHGYQVTQFSLKSKEHSLKRTWPAYPFVPSEISELSARCEQILTIQMQGLRKRLEHVGARAAVIGLSGGLDSTLALLVTARAFDALGLDRSGIVSITMPGFGTTDRTYSNALELARSLGTTLREIPIQAAVLQHFADIGHPVDQHDVTYENSQARERTQILMDIANQISGLVIGTGDLSELALGWATYNGDHMSMYGVNASVPKTLIRHLVAHAARQAEAVEKQEKDTIAEQDKIPARKLSAVLRDVLATPVSPELLPPQDGEISQKTEHLVGPYALHDFFLYYFVRYGFSPAKIRRLAKSAFAGDEELEPQIDRWLEVFIRRFFSQQFKRSCLPDGPKVGSVTLSPRGDWRMPSDASAELWLEDLRRAVDMSAD